MKYGFSMSLYDDSEEVAPEEIERQREQIRSRMGKVEFVDDPEDMPEIHVENMPGWRINHFYKHILDGTRKFVQEGGCK